MLHLEILSQNAPTHKMQNNELEGAVQTLIAASAFYRDALSQIRELTKSKAVDMLCIRRSCSEALDAIDVGAQFMDALNKLNIENNTMRSLLGNAEPEVEQEPTIN